MMKSTPLSKAEKEIIVDQFMEGEAMVGLAAAFSVELRQIEAVIRAALKEGKR